MGGGIRGSQRGKNNGRRHRRTRKGKKEFTEKKASKKEKNPERLNQVQHRNLTGGYCLFLLEAYDWAEPQGIIIGKRTGKKRTGKNGEKKTLNSKPSRSTLFTAEVPREEEPKRTSSKKKFWRVLGEGRAGEKGNPSEAPPPPNDIGQCPPTERPTNTGKTWAGLGTKKRFRLESKIKWGAYSYSNRAPLSPSRKPRPGEHK